jgi:hypothetical protein
VPASEISLDDLEALGHDYIAENFIELSGEVAQFNENLRSPLLYGAKGIMVFGELSKDKNFGPSTLAAFRQGCSWMVFCKGKVGEAVGKLEHKLKVFRATSADDVMRELARKGVKISDAKIEDQLRKNDKFQELEAQLSVLNGIFAHVSDHCFQYRLLKDIIIQESANVRQMMKDSAQEERGIGYE